jgi:putative membrane protein
MYWGYGWPMFWNMFFWGLLWLVFIGAGIWLLGRWLSHSMIGASHPRPDEPSAIEILNRRYARGEIDSETFEQMRDRLGAGGRKQS